MGEPSFGEPAGVRELGRAHTRAAWTILDQVLSSGTNFALTIVVARLISAEAFGAFAVGSAIYVVGAGVSRALCNEPLVVRFSEHPSREIMPAARTMTAAALVLGLIAGAALLVGSVFTSDTLRPVLAAFAICLPIVFWQDSLRSVCFAAKASHLAALNDGVWAAALLLGIAVPASRSVSTSAPIVLLWGGSALVASITTVLVLRLWPALRGAGQWLREHVDLGGRFAVEFILLFGGMQVVTFALAFTGGLDAAGAFRGAIGLLGPVTIVIFGLAAVATPEAARLTGDLHRLRRIIVVLTVVLILAVLVWVGLAALLPDSVGEALLGATWAGTEPVLVPLGLAVAGTGAVVGVTVGLRALAAARRSLRANIAATILLVSGGVIGGVINGAVGAAVGLIAPAWLGLALYAWQFRFALKDGPVRKADAPR